MNGKNYKTAVVTGGNSGIGKAAALALAQKQFRVILHGKDPEKTLLAAREIRDISGNQQVEGISVDISSVRGMRKLSDSLRQKTDSIEALVLSTGVILPKQVFTPDGLEAGFAIQYLSRFAVTHFLMEELTRGNAKIVMVGAPVIPGAKIFFDDITLKSNFTMVRAMAQEMFANHLFVQEFARRNPGNQVVINMANVGVANTGIVRHSNFIFKIGVSLFGTTAQKAAKNAVYLASDPGVNFSGYFLGNPRNSGKMEKNNFDPAVAARLWELSLQLISAAS